MLHQYSRTKKTRYTDKLAVKRRKKENVKFNKTRKRKSILKWYLLHVLRRVDLLIMEQLCECTVTLASEWWAELNVHHSLGTLQATHVKMFPQCVIYSHFNSKILQKNRISNDKSRETNLQRNLKCLTKILAPCCNVWPTVVSNTQSALKPVI